MRLALGVEYDGGAFNGFQHQQNAPSVQEALEAALSKIADQRVRIAAAGRTDSGVHATTQVVSFETPVERAMNAWLRGANALTPAAVKVRWVRRVDDAFHARFSAAARRYQYVYYEDAVPSPLLEGRVMPVSLLDDEAMHRAAQALVGEHDFTSFRAAGCQSLSAHRCVHRIMVHRLEAFVVLDVTANAFLLHMVRNLAGALQRVGEGSRSEGWIAEILERRDRSLAGRTAPPHGLYLVDVSYPGYAFPPGRPAPMLWARGGLDQF